MEHSKAVERINNEVSGIILKHLGSSCIGLIVQGSAVKGGFIQGSSDIDYVLYVDDAALNDASRLPAELCLAIHQDLSNVDVRPFRYIQFSVLSLRTNTYLGPIAYQLLTVIHKDGTRIWSLKKQETVSLLTSIPAVQNEITAFYQSVQSYYPTEHSALKALKVIEDGLSFISAAKCYWLSLKP